MPGTMFDVIWDDHVVRRGEDDEPDLLYVDLHFLHEITSPQAFNGLRRHGRGVRRPDLTIAVEDHNVPTDLQGLWSATPQAREQVEALRSSCEEHGIRLERIEQGDQGIVHVIGPELGMTQPGVFIVCGDSHTSTHGALGALAMGIGTSEVEHVLATQTLLVRRPRTMLIELVGMPSPDVTSKDLALAIVAQVGTGGAQGHVVEYRGPAVSALSAEGRMTLCNMSIEMGARAGAVAPDATTFEYLRGRPHVPADVARAEEYWSSFAPGPDERHDRRIEIDATKIRPRITWGTNPGQGFALGELVPDPASFEDVEQQRAAQRALDYMGLEPGQDLRDVPVDVVFVGSCTNGRIEDLRVAAAVLKGKSVADGVRMLIVPGSLAVRREAEAEGLDQVFLDAGAEWRGAGCSMCVGINGDQPLPGQRVASTSNRNFEGRQGAGVRTHLTSPAVAAATAITGRMTAPADP